MNDLLQTILERAERRWEDSTDEAFFPTVLQQSLSDLELHGLTAWTHDETSQSLVASFGMPSESPYDLDALRMAVTGHVSTIRSSSNGQTSGRTFLAAASVSRDRRLVLAAEEGLSAFDQDVLAPLAEICADLYRRELVEEWDEFTRGSHSLQGVLLRLHSTLDSDVVANVLATDASCVLPARTLAVARRFGRRWQIVATTGVSQPNDRSDAVREIQSEIEAAVSGDTVSDNKTVLPLHPTGEWGPAGWAVVIEHDDELPNALLRQLQTHASLALANCDDVADRSSASWLRRRLWIWSRPKTLVWSVIAAAIVLCLILIPVELRIEAYGELVPAQRQFVFAPEDGTIAELHVDDGMAVADGDLLCVLTNEALDDRHESISGDLAAANARLASIAALRSTGRADTAEARLLSAEQAELDVKVQSLVRQKEILDQRLRHLQVRTDQMGVVYGDRLRQVLSHRPVVRGQYLFEVSDLATGWQLELRIEETDIRHVQRACRQDGTMPSVSYCLETSADVIRETTLTTLAASSAIQTTGQISTLATAELSATDFPDQRPGAGVIARIDCGKRSVGFVWFRRVIETLSRNWF